MSEQQKCGLCGEPMPPGEEMFEYHGYSSPCPKLPPGAKKLFGLSEAEVDLLLAENAALKSRIDTIAAALRASTELLCDLRDCNGIGIDEIANRIAANEAAMGGAK